MKHLIFILGLVISPACFAQQDEVILEDLEIPSSPGFILLDEAPTSIERPNTGKAFIASVLNSFEGEGFPKNYAVEFTPFWFFKHPNMNVLKYAGYENNKQQPFHSLKMASLSVAYINSTDTVTGNDIKNVAVGVRTNIFKIYSKSRNEAINKANVIAVSYLKNLDSVLVAEGATPALLISDPVKYREIEKRVFAQRNHLSPFEEALKIKPVLSLEFAAAYNRMFLENDFSNNHFGRFGAWLTLNTSIKWQDNYLNLYALGRYLSDGTMLNGTGGYETVDNMDIGGKLEFEFRKLSIGYEFLHRSGSDIESTYRSSGQLKYKISDNLRLTGAFGKNFGDSDNLISLLGLNWGLDTGNEKAKVE